MKSFHDIKVGDKVVIKFETQFSGSWEEIHEVTKVLQDCFDTTYSNLRPWDRELPMPHLFAFNGDAITGCVDYWVDRLA